MNPLYQSYQENQNRNSGGLQKTASEMIAFLTSRMMTPEQMVRRLLQNREMSQAQFEQYSKLADQYLGKNR